jgi:hypothetical protein
LPLGRPRNVYSSDTLIPFKRRKFSLNIEKNSREPAGNLPVQRGQLSIFCLIMF